MDAFRCLLLLLALMLAPVNEASANQAHLQCTMITLLRDDNSDADFIKKNMEKRFEIIDKGDTAVVVTTSPYFKPLTDEYTVVHRGPLGVIAYAPVRIFSNTLAFSNNFPGDAESPMRASINLLGPDISSTWMLDCKPK